MPRTLASSAGRERKEERGRGRERWRDGGREARREGQMDDTFGTCCTSGIKCSSGMRCEFLVIRKFICILLAALSTAPAGEREEQETNSR